MKYIKKSQWKPKDGIELESTAKEVIACESNSSVLAGPGSGKTELLAQNACYLLETNTSPFPKKILAISFKRDAAKNLKKRVEDRCSKEYAHRFISLTFHSFAKQLLDQFRMAIPEPYRPTSDYDIVSFNRIKRGEDKSRLTFKMILRIVEYVFRLNPKLLHALRSTYSHVFLDEFQDTTSVQYDLVKTLFKDTAVTLTAVGDLKQRIMGWAGAKSGIFRQFKVDFNAEEFEMVLNHRSAPHLVEIQTSLINDMMNSAIEIEPSDHLKKEKESFCEIWHFEDEVEEANLLAQEISRLVQDEKVDKRDIGILVRQKADKYCGELIKALNTVGIDSRIEDKWQDLLAENFMPYLLDMLTLVTSQRDAEAWSNIISNINILHGVEDREEYNIEIELNKFIRSIKETMESYEINTTESVENLLWEILDFIDIELIKSRYSEYTNGTYLKNKIEQTAELLCISLNKQNDWSGALEDFLGIYSVPIMTIHKSKGLEFDSVIILGLEDGAFWNYKNKPNEETLTFFVGLSRAKRNLILTYSSGRFGGQTRSEIIDLYRMLNEAGVEEKMDEHWEL